MATISSKLLNTVVMLEDLPARKLREAEEELETANRELEKVLKKLGLGG